MEENIKTTASILGILTFIAYLNQYFYYWYYDIDISNYIGIDEVFTPFLDDLLMDIILLLFCYGFVYLRNKSKRKDEDNNETVNPPKGKSLLIFILLLVCTLGVPILIIIKYNNYLLGAMLLCIMVAYCIHFYFIVYTDITEKNHEKYPVSITLWSVMSFVLIVNLIFTINTILKNEYINSKVVYRFVLNDTLEVLTDHNNIYLGRTKKVFFIDRRKNDRVSIYNTDDITYEEIR